MSAIKFPICIINGLIHGFGFLTVGIFHPEEVTNKFKSKFTHREIKNNYQFENCLTLITKPAHRISLTRRRLGCHALRIQTGKYENRGALIPVEERTCLVCKEDGIEHEQHFLM